MYELGKLKITLSYPCWLKLCVVTPVGQYYCLEISVMGAMPTLWRKKIYIKKTVILLSFVLGIQIGFWKSFCFKDSLTFRNWSPLQSRIFFDVFKYFMCSVNVIMPLILFAETSNFIPLSRCSATSGVFVWTLKVWSGFVWKDGYWKFKTSHLEVRVQWMLAPQVSEQSKNKF